MIGLTYAQLYPDRVRARCSTDRPTLSGGQAVSIAASRSASARQPTSGQRSARVLPRVLPGRRARAACTFAAADTTAKFDTLMARLLAGPITVDLPSGPPGPGGPTTLTYAFVADGLRGGLQFPPIWSDLAGLLQATFAASDDTPNTSVTPPSAATGLDDYDNSREALLAVSCPETRNPTDPKRWIERGSRRRTRRPVLRCRLRLALTALRDMAGTRSRRRRRNIRREDGEPDAVPEQPLRRRQPAVRRGRRRRPHARRPAPHRRRSRSPGLLHPRTGCVADAISAYLIDQVIPAAGATCQAEFEPFGP